MTIDFGTNGALSRLSKREIVAGSADRVAETGIVPLQRAEVRAGIRVEQQLVRIEAMARLRLIRAVHAITVNRARAEIGHVAMPHLVGVVRQIDPSDFCLAVTVEEAQLHAVAWVENRLKLTPAPSQTAPGR